jgi:Cu2+-exporting ATPase
VQYAIAHAVRGRLRIRYPASWLSRRRAAVEASLRGIPGVRRVDGNPVTGSVLIDYDPFRLAEDALVGSLHELSQALGAPARLDGASRPRRLATPAAPLLALLGTSSVLALSWLPVAAPLRAALVLASGLPTLVRGVHALARRRRVDGDVLEASTFGLLGLRGNWPAAALLTGLRAAGDYIVAKSVVTTRRSVRELVGSWDGTVERVEGSSRGLVSVATLRPGDVVVIAAGQMVPVDGTVVQGEALVNQQTMTGEALPVERQVADGVFAATVVEHGEIQVRVDHVGLETAVGRIVEAIEKAADEKPDIQVFAERLADRGVARTVGLAALGTAFARSLDAGVAILVADYGTAARVGIPAAVLAVMKRAATEGVLIKGPRTLERLARVDTVVFDKTGTLTSGAPRIARVVRYARALDDDGLLRLVAAAERGFQHPVARAIGRLAAERGLRVPRGSGTVSRIGLGVEVDVEGAHVAIGSRRFMESCDVELTAGEGDERAAHQSGGAPTFVAIDGRLAGLLVLQDELRPDAREAVRALKARSMRDIILLSGDHPEPSRVIAESLGLETHHAGLSPEQKAALIRRFKRDGRVVAMVGDGVNDALALQEADVGIAVPGGAPVAAAAADIMLLSGGLDRVVRALDLAGEAIEAVRRTISVAARANLGVVALASLGLARPRVSILLSHGVTLGAALATTRPAPAPREPRPRPRARGHKNVGRSSPN